MRIATLLVRILLGLVFSFFGLNHLFHFLHEPGMPAGDAAAFAVLLNRHHYMTFIGILMTVAGLLLLVGRYVPIALVVLGPILVNILMFHVLFHHPGLGPGTICTIFEMFLIYAYWDRFRRLFENNPTSVPRTKS